MSEPVKIAIVLEGGIVQNVLSAGVPVQFVVVDYDTDDAEPDEVSNVPQFDGMTDTGATAEAFVRTGTAEPHGPFVLAAFAAERED